MAKTKRIRTRRGRVTLAVLSIIVLALVAFFVYRGVSGNAQAAVTYSTGTVKKMTLTSSVSGTGNIDLPDSATIAPTVSGTVSGLAVKVGDTVKQGQALFTVVDPQLDVDVAQAQNTYDTAVLAVYQAQLNVLQDKKNLTTLYEGSYTSLEVKQDKAAISAAELAVTAAQNTVASDKLALQTAKDNAAARKVSAPMSGVITSLSVANGDSVTGSSGSSSTSSSATSSSSTGSSSSSSSSASSGVMTITDPSTYEATVTLSESDISPIKLGQKAVLTFDALPDLTLSGKVTRIDTVGTDSSGVVSYNVIVTPDVMNSSVKGGMTVSVNIITSEAADVMAVPTSAVKTSGGVKYVQVLQNGQPTDVTVQTGISNDSYTQITNGLSEDQQIVTGSTSTSSSKSTAATTTRSSSSNALRQGSSIINGGGGAPYGMPPGQ